MSDLPNLLLDLGNSSVKYALFSQPFVAESFQIERVSLEELQSQKFELSSIFFSSVLDDESNRTIFKLGDKLNVPVYQCKSQDSQFGIINAYQYPSNMGDDRWMAIIATGILCGKKGNENAMVVDSGSAITCDFIVDGNHIGGWIAPGIKMLRDTVVANTKRVFDNQHSSQILTLGTDTPQCVSNGALAQVSGMVKQGLSLMQQHANYFDVFISGGDAQSIMRVIKQTTLKNDKYSVHYIENLVLVGLARIASEKSL